MKIFFTLVLSFLILARPAFAESKMEIFSDSGFSAQTTKFSSNQAIYIKIESDDPGEKERILRLKDNQYNDISTFQLSREGGGPFVYKVSFPAPNAAGFYSIEATIASSGSQNKLVKTIQVGAASTANTKINVRTEVKGTKTRQTPTPTPTPIVESQTPESSPQTPIATPSALTTSPNLWQKILEFFQNVFKFFFRF